MKTYRWLSLAAPLTCLLAGACAAPDSVDRSGPAEPQDAPSEALSLEGWGSETIELPPGFAPELPRGVESLLFAPGWREAGAEDHWSYVFAMWIEDFDADVESLDAMLEQYYDGLMSAVAQGADRDIGTDSAQVEVQRTGAGRFEAQIEMIDSFGDFEPIALNMRIESAAAGERTLLRIQASPQGQDHPIWSTLAAAVAGIEAPAE